MADLPEAFKNQMQTRLGPAFEAFLESLDQPSPVSIRYNTAKLQPAAGTPIPWCPSGRYLNERPLFTFDPRFHAGGYYVQEASSMLIEQAVLQSINLSKPRVVLDLCAAPGGKSTHLLSLLDPESLLVANEVIRSRANILIENIEKWGADNVVVTNSDPSDFDRLPESFDLILVDAPCSGEGLFRKDPEAMQEWSPKNVDLCSLRQRRILSDVWPALKQGGVLIYSTCTFNHHENMDNLAWFAKQCDLTFEKLKLPPAWGVETMSQNTITGYQCLPHRVNGEGFFFAVLRKGGEPIEKRIRSKETLQLPSATQLGTAKDWVMHGQDEFFFLHGQHLRVMPALLKGNLQVILERLHVLQAGTGIGEIMKNRIVPDHALALSVKRNKNLFPGIDLDRTLALDYLRKNPLHLPDCETGFQVIAFEGLGLGWVNILPGRVNNLFPASRRVRLGDEPKP